MISGKKEHVHVYTCVYNFLPHMQCNTAELSLTEELLYVHKIQAVVDFCGECKKLLKAFKLEMNNPEGMQYIVYFMPWILC